MNKMVDLKGRNGVAICVLAFNTIRDDITIFEFLHPYLSPSGLRKGLPGDKINFRNFIIISITRKKCGGFRPQPNSLFQQSIQTCLKYLYQFHHHGTGATAAITNTGCTAFAAVLLQHIQKCYKNPCSAATQRMAK